MVEAGFASVLGNERNELTRSELQPESASSSRAKGASGPVPRHELVSQSELTSPVRVRRELSSDGQGRGRGRKRRRGRRSSDQSRACDSLRRASRGADASDGSRRGHGRGL